MVITKGIGFKKATLGLVQFHSVFKDLMIGIFILPMMLFKNTVTNSVNLNSETKYLSKAFPNI